MRTYRGYRRVVGVHDGVQHDDGVVVTVEYNGRIRPLPLFLGIRSHSPCGFEWGYGGSGPAQLALALVAHVTGSRAEMPWIYQRVKATLVAGLAKDGWVVTDETIWDHIRAAVKESGRSIPPRKAKGEPL